MPLKSDPMVTLGGGAFVSGPKPLTSSGECITFASQ